MKKRSPNKWFIGDTHFWHANVINFENRPYSTVEEMNDDIIKIINRYVQPEDTIIWLGDICFGNSGKWANIFSKITCKNHILIEGNHDKKNKYPKKLFKAVFQSAELSILGQDILLSHYPYKLPWYLRLFRRERYRNRKLPNKGKWLVHGHVHSSWRVKNRMINVGWDVWGRPVKDKEIVAITQRGSYGK